MQSQVSRCHHLLCGAYPHIPTWLYLSPTPPNKKKSRMNGMHITFYFVEVQLCPCIGGMQSSDSYCLNAYMHTMYTHISLGVPKFQVFWTSPVCTYRISLNRSRTLINSRPRIGRFVALLLNLLTRAPRIGRHTETVTTVTLSRMRAEG